MPKLIHTPADQSPQALPRDLALKVGVQQVAQLEILGRQARTHSDAQIRAIAESIKKFGFLNPILIDEDSRVLVGVARLAAAKLIGMTDVPCVVVGHLTPVEKRTYVLAENRLAELAGWDRRILGIELKELHELDPDFELDVTGWSDIEIETLIVTSEEFHHDEEPEKPARPTSRIGDAWQLGAHRLLCGDALDDGSYERLMQGERAGVVNTDPPYNVEVAGHVTSDRRYSEFAMASGEMSDDEFVAFLTRVLDVVRGRLKEGGLIYMAMDWRHVWHVTTAARSLSLEQLNLCVWNKGRAGMGAFYRSQYELYFVLKSGAGKHANRIQLGRHGRDRSNVWDYPGNIGIPAKGGEQKVFHPSPKNVDMICDALLDCSEPGEIVLDPFGGGGSLLIAAERTGRRARVIELDPGYVDVMIDRWQRFTGRRAILEATGQTFAEVAASRTALTTRVCHRPPPTSGPPTRVRIRTLASKVRG